MGWGDVSADPGQEAGTSFAQRMGRGDPIKVRGGFSFLLICPPGFTSSHHRLSKKATVSLPGHAREAGLGVQPDPSGPTRRGSSLASAPLAAPPRAAPAVCAPRSKAAGRMASMQPRPAT